MWYLQFVVGYPLEIQHSCGILPISSWSTDQKWCFSKVMLVNQMVFHQFRHAFHLFPWCKNNLSTKNDQNWLVVYLPLWKIWVRQLGWWHSQLNGKIKVMFQSPPSRKRNALLTRTLRACAGWAHGLRPAVSWSLGRSPGCRSGVHGTRGETVTVR